MDGHGDPDRCYRAGKTAGPSLAGLLLALALAVAHPAILVAQASPPARSVTLSGMLLANYQHHVEDGVDDFQQGQVRAGLEESRFMLERAYLTAQVVMSERARVRLTLETRDGGEGQELRMKYAYVEYRPQVLHATRPFIRAGLLQNIMIAHEEVFWPRLVSSAPLARAGYYPAADLGVAVGATLPRKLGEVYAEVVDGRGYQGIGRPDDRFRDVAVRLTLTPLAGSPRSGALRTLTVSPWLYLGDTASVFGPGSEWAGAAGYLGPVREGRQRDRYGLLVGVDDRRVSAGLSLARRRSETDTGENTAGSPAGVAVRHATLASAFAVVRPFTFGDPEGGAPLGVVLRYDRVDSDRSAPGYTSYLVGGLTYDLSPGVSLSLDYQETMPRAGQAPTRSTQRQVYFVHLRADF